jgi:hypothetical protein
MKPKLKAKYEKTKRAKEARFLLRLRIKNVSLLNCYAKSNWKMPQSRDSQTGKEVTCAEISCHGLSNIPIYT